jgi:toxin FitB
MSFLVDTNAISELRLSRRADPKVIAWFKSVAQSELFLSAITLFELERGHLSLARRDPAQAVPLRDWLEGTIRASFSDRILPIDDTVAVRCAALHVPDRRPLPDSLIAATALVHGLTVVTRNEADFGPMGVDIVNPWL